MNKSIKYLALAAMAVSSNISAHSDHTYMNLKSSNVNLPMELTTFYERTQMKLDHRFGGNLQVSGFYGESNGNFGSYFGMNGDSTYILGTAAQRDATPATADTVLRYLIHDWAHEIEDTPAKVSYNPETESYGARFDYYQNMDKLLKGLYLKVNTTIVCVENDMDLGVHSSDSAMQTNLYKFFTGKYEQTNATDPGNAQEEVERGLIKGEHNETGLADIDVILGYKFLYKDKYHFGINIAITIPTGEEPDGKLLFEPIYGNGSHFGFGGGLDAHANLWTKHEQNIKLNFAANYRYLFEASEHRPLKLKDYLSPYVLLGDSSTVNAPLIPAVNVLSHNGVDVTPGSQFDGILALAYNNGGFSADLGYNLYYRDEEDVDFRGKIEEDRFGVASVFYRTNLENYTFGTNPIDFDGEETAWISRKDVDEDAAATPSQLTNGIYGGLGYHFKKWEYPFLMGIGGKYDWANENSIPNSWMVWGKLSLSF